MRVAASLRFTAKPSRFRKKAWITGGSNGVALPQGMSVNFALLAVTAVHVSTPSVLASRIYMCISRETHRDPLGCGTAKQPMGAIKGRFASATTQVVSGSLSCVDLAAV